MKNVDTNYVLCICRDGWALHLRHVTQISAMKTTRIWWKRPEKQRLYPINNLEVIIVVNKAICHYHRLNSVSTVGMAASIFKLVRSANLVVSLPSELHFLVQWEKRAILLPLLWRSLYWWYALLVLHIFIHADDMPVSYCTSSLVLKMCLIHTA